MWLALDCFFSLRSKRSGFDCVCLGGDVPCAHTALGSVFILRFGTQLHYSNHIVRGGGGIFHMFYGTCCSLFYR